MSTIVHSANIVGQIGKKRLMIVTSTLILWLLNIPQSSCITGPLLLKVLDLEKKHIRGSKEDRIIVVTDIHKSNFTVDSIIYARENGSKLVSFLPLPSSIRATGCTGDETI